MVAVARNPVEARYVKEHGAPGAIRLCIRLGKAMQEAGPRGGVAAAESAASVLGGRVVEKGRVKGLELNCAGGFDTGKLHVGNSEITFWNEYMTLEDGGQRLGTFPDLIMTLEACSVSPVTSAELREGLEVIVLQVPAERLILGEGVRHAPLLAEAERVVGKPLLPFIDPGVLAV